MRGMLMGLVMLMAAGAVRGEVVVINNLYSSGQGSSSAGGAINQYGTSTALAQKFTLASNQLLSSVDFNIYDNGSSTFNFTVGIMANTDYSGFSGPSNTYLKSWTGNQADTSNTLGSALKFNFSSGGENYSSGDYWLVVQVTSGDTSGLSWANGVSNSIGAQAYSTASLGLATNFNGGNTVSPGGYGFQINAVPEPGTLLLGGIAAACGGGGVWWRRKRKAAPVADETVAAE